MCNSDTASQIQLLEIQEFFNYEIIFRSVPSIGFPIFSDSRTLLILILRQPAIFPATRSLSFARESAISIPIIIWIALFSSRPRRTKRKREKGKSASLQRNKGVQWPRSFTSLGNGSSCPRSRQSHRYYLISPVPCSLLLYKSSLGGCSHSYARALPTICQGISNRFFLATTPPKQYARSLF